jgi:DNA-binding NarL/FixJ family response regulator
MIKLPEGSIVAPPWRVEANLKMLLGKKFSRRQLQVIHLGMSPRSNEEISSALGINVKTTKYYFFNIYKKLGVKNRVQMIYLISDLLRPEGESIQKR